jgi:hypothetical protein
MRLASRSLATSGRLDAETHTPAADDLRACRSPARGVVLTDLPIVRGERLVNTRTCDRFRDAPRAEAGRGLPRNAASPDAGRAMQRPLETPEVDFVASARAASFRRCADESR